MNLTIFQNKRLVIMILALIGMWLGMYLYYEFVTQNVLGVCDLSETINCKPVTTGNLARFLGIPVALIGITGYLVILVTAYFQKFKWTFAMASFGMLFCLRLMFLEIFVEKVVCPICVACQIVMLTVFLISWKLAFAKSALTPTSEQ